MNNSKTASVSQSDSEAIGYVADLEKFMTVVALKLKCLPSFADPHPEQGNKHIIEKLNKLLSK